MAIPRFIYGDSYGDVGNRQLASDSAADSRFFNSLAAQRAQQQIEDSRQSGDEQMALAMAQMAQQDAARRDDLDYKYTSAGQNADLFNRQLDSQRQIAQMQMDAQKQNLAAGTNDQLYKEAYTHIKTGVISTPQELEAFAKSRLTPDQKSQLMFVIDQAGRERGDLFNKSKLAADALNAEYTRRLAPFASQHAKVDEAMLTARDEPYAGGRVNPLNWFTKTKGDLNAEDMMYQTKRDQFMQEVNQPKSPYASLVSMDPVSGHFVPSVPEPRFVPPGQSRTQPQVGTGIAPAGTPLLGGPATDESKWIPIPAKSGTVTIDPVLYKRIVATAASLPTDTDRAAYTQQEFAKAVAAGRAKRAASAPAHFNPTSPLGYLLQGPVAPFRDAYRYWELLKNQGLL